MRTFAGACFIALTMLGAFAKTTWAQANAKADSAAQPKPEVVLRQMTDYIGGLPAFSCRLEVAIRIQAPGMDNRMVTKTSLRLERPNRLAVVAEEGTMGMVMGMTVISDGKQLVQFMPMLQRYTVQEAPADLSKLSEDAATQFAMSGMPIAMIPASGEALYKALMEGVTNSEYLGSEKVGEVLCHHCRFAQESFSWDIWIEAGDRPLPHQVVPDFSKQFAADERMKDTKLEYSATFSEWNTAPKFTAADFAFTPPADAEKVDSLLEGLAGGGAEGPHPLLGQPAPVFQTVGLDEKPIDLKSHLGKNVVLLDFWATWCGPCVEAMPNVDAVAKKYADRGLVFYAVNVAEDAETIKEFLKTAQLEVPVAMDPDSSITQLYQANGIPQTVLIGKDGKVQVVHVGFSENLAEVLSQEVEELLAGKDLAAESLKESEQSQQTTSETAEQP